MSNKEERPGLFSRIERQHPFLTLIYLAILGSGILFLFLMVAFTHSLSKQPDVAFPRFFVVSTFILLISSYFAEKAWQDFRHEQIGRLKKDVGIVVLLGIGFAVSQLLGWRELVNSGVYLNSPKTAGGYLYVLSGLHIVHLLGGLIFALVQWLRIGKTANDGVQTLVFFTNSYEKLRMRLLGTYWHFLDVVWILLFFYFLFAL